MFEYTSEKEIKEIILRITNTLADIEVKGSNVENMFLARAALKDVFESLKELEVEKEDIKTKEE